MMDNLRRGEERSGAPPRGRREIDLGAELERRLKRPTTAAEMQMLYAEAYRAVRDLIRAEGEAALWRRIAASE